MSRVLMERNYYKEQLLDLQETLRLTEMLRAERHHAGFARPKKRGRIWELFSKLFSPSKRRQSNAVHSIESDNRNAASQNTGSGLSPSAILQNVSQSVTPGRWNDCSFSSNTMITPYVRAKSPLNSLLSDSLQLHSSNWMFPQTVASRSIFFDKLHFSPELCYVRPVSENLSGFKVFCASNVFSRVCDTNPDWFNNSSVNQSKFPEDPLISSKVNRRFPSSELISTPNQNLVHRHDQRTCSESPDSKYLSNLFWVCSLPITTRQPGQSGVSTSTAEKANSNIHSLITIMDSNDPEHSIDSFGITISTVLCMTAFPATDRETQAYLQQTSQHWSAVPLDLSEELLSLGRRTNSVHQTQDNPVNSTVPVPSTLSQRTCWSASSYSFSTAHRHPSLFEVGGCNQNAASSSSASHMGTSQQLDSLSCYSIERRRFVVRNLHSEYCDSGPFEVSSNVGQESASSNVCSTSTNELPSSTVTTVPEAFSNPTNHPNGSQPTMWIGCYNGDVFVHSTYSQWRRALHAIHLPDAIIQICHFKGYAFISLANGQIVVFRRRLQSPHPSMLSSSVQSVRALVSSSNLPDDGVLTNVSPTNLSSRLPLSSSTYSANTSDGYTGTWDFTEACVISCGHARPSNRLMVVVSFSHSIWVSSCKRITVIDATTLQSSASFELTLDQSSQIHLMEAVGEAVWITVRSDPLIYSYHATKHHLLQTVDLTLLLSEKFPSLKLKGLFSCHADKPQFSITALSSSANHLWIGTNSGVVATIPWKKPGSEANRTASDDLSAHVAMGYVVPSLLQISRGKHDGAVRFFTTVRSTRLPLRATADCLSLDKNPKDLNRKVCRPSSSWSNLSPSAVQHAEKKLILSGGRGYTFLEDGSNSRSKSAGQESYLMVWDDSTT